MAMKLYRVTVKRSIPNFRIVEGMSVEVAANSLSLSNSTSKKLIAEAIERKYSADREEFYRYVSSSYFELEELG